jgi:hypothetical protein
MPSYAMLTVERFNSLFLLFFAGLAWVRPLPLNRRIRIGAIGLCGVSLIAGAARIGGPLRDWLPSLILLMVYWQAGGFFSGPDDRLQSRLLALDHKALRSTFLRTAWPVGRNVGIYLEVCYLFCYPLVPLGIGLLYLSGRREYVSYYWMVVLPSAYLCYAMLPFFQTLPPRLLPEDSKFPATSNPVRRLNLWLLRYASVHANSFPSAHVATTMAASLALAHILPLAGFIFFWTSFSIAVAVVLGRYHYLGDSILGCAIAAAVFMAATFLF